LGITALSLSDSECRRPKNNDEDKRMERKRKRIMRM
jgi:hypothetical protein